MDIKKDLEAQIIRAYNLISEYQEIILLSSRPKEKFHAQKQIDEIKLTLEKSIERYFHIVDDNIGTIPTQVQSIIDQIPSFSNQRPSAMATASTKLLPYLEVPSSDKPSSTKRKLASFVSSDSHALIMKGGGVKGLAYVGALKELLNYYSFEWFVGTSAGAIAAVLLASGYTVEELKEELSDKNFKDFLDAQFLQSIWNLLNYKGLYHAYTVSDWIDELLAKKLNSPTQVKLKDLKYRATIYASRRGIDALVFDSTDPQTQDISASFAVRCSMALPFFFTPQMSEGMRVLDGGLRNNYPVEQLLKDHPSQKFVGLYLGPETYEGSAKPNSLATEILSIWTEAIDIQALQKYSEKTVIIDPRPISTIDFSLNDKEKEFLIRAGKLAGLKFLHKHKKLPNSVGLSKLEIEINEIRQELTLQRFKTARRRRVIIVLLVLALASALSIVIWWIKASMG